MSRICICVSGQMRASGAGLESLKRALDGYDATIIFSVWNRFGRKTAGAINSHQLGRIFSTDALLAFPSRWIGWKAFSQALPSLIPLASGEEEDESDRIREYIRSFFPDAIIDIEDGNLLDLSFDSKKEDSNSIRMLYKIWRANEIKRKIEKNQGNFDIVLRVRPDTLLNKIDIDLILGPDKINTVFVNHFIPGGRFVGDTFAAGSSRNLDIYANLFGHVLRDRNSWSFIHTEIHDHLVRYGLNYAQYAHYGNLAPDQTLSARAVAEHLADPASVPDGGTPLHRITREVMLASASLTEGDVSAALTRLSRVPDNGDAVAYDGCLVVLGAALHAAERPFDAICCWLAAKWVTDTCCVYDPNTAYRERLPGTIVDSLILHAGSAPDANLDAFADRIASRILPLGTEFAVLEKAIGSDEAQEKFRASVVAFINDSSLEDAVARRIVRLPKDETARINLLRAADWVVHDVNTMYPLAHTLKKARRYHEARHWQERATLLAPEHPGAQRQMAEIYFHLGDIDNAVRHAQTAYRLAPGMAEIALLTEYADFVVGRPSPRAPSHETTTIDPPSDFQTLPRFGEFMASRSGATAT